MHTIRSDRPASATTLASKAKVRPAPSINDEYPFIETLRGFASLFVLLNHTRNWFFEVTTLSAANKLLLPFYFATALAREAVIVFFVVSGFLVGGRAITAIAQGRFSIRHYFAARSSRIYIAYIPALLVTVLLLEAVWLADPGMSGSMSRELLIERESGLLGGSRSVACHLANLQGVFCPYTRSNPALWSLGYEWVLYVIAPVLIFAFRAEWSAWSRALIVLLTLLAVYALVIDPVQAAILGGIWFLSAVSYRQLLRGMTPDGAAFAALGVFCIVLIIGRLKIWDLGLTNSLIGISLAIALSSRAVLMIDILPRISRFLASFSFSLYVTHLPVAFSLLFLMRQAGIASHPAAMGIAPMVQFGLLVSGCLGFAYAFSRLTEAHTGRLRRWLLDAGPAPAQREAA